MTAQILNNLSLASLPIIAGTIVIGMALTGLALWIIQRGRTQLLPGEQTRAIFRKIDVLQAERQRADQDHADGNISNDDHASACRDIAKFEAPPRHP
ncbi:MAG: hypothetical protein EBT71_04875, partial [Alphaproteobacteria bacterium]|nr:hypothetical protein [Alphaproteobacteria bacterium]